jgi:hypothetical protein
MEPVCEASAIARCDPVESALETAVMLEDLVVQCPGCWETIEIRIDLSGGSATYAEDCPVCCRPMTVRLEVDAGASRFHVKIEQEDA